MKKVRLHKTETGEESNTRFRTIFETSKLGNKIINSDLTILEVNKAMAELLGYSSKEDIIGKEILDYSPQEHHAHWKNLQIELWERMSSYFKLETSLIKKDGSIIWCHVTSILFQDDDEILGYSIIEDITKKHSLKQQKEDFISVASHELKTPITSLKAGLQLMNRIIKNETSISNKLQKLAVDAELNSIKLTHLVEDLLNISKLEQGDFTLNKTKFKLSDIVDNCCSHIALAGNYHIKFQGSHSLKVFGDQPKIEQVLINLVNNSIKYAPDSEEIKIKAEKMKDKVRISVTDKGPGIAAAKIPHLFDRYYQVNKPGVNKTGLGLGLYISSQIIKSHQGDMGVDSKIGKGSSFWFTLPVEKR